MGTEFNKNQFDAIYPEGVENHYWNICRNKVIKYTLKKANAMNDILEVGCGTGVVTEYLHKAGFGIKGVELADTPVKESQRSYVRTNLSVFDINEHESNSVGTVLLLDVIEHLEKPKEFLKGIKDKFPNLKRFIITVPARQEIFSNYDRFNGHYRRYDINMLRGEFSQFNPKSMESSYFFHSLYWPARLLVALKKDRAENLKAPEGSFQKMINKLLGKLFYTEFFLVPSGFRGSSLIISVEL